jgi:hypothetical protein
MLVDGEKACALTHYEGVCKGPEGHRSTGLQGQRGGKGLKHFAVVPQLLLASQMRFQKFTTFGDSTNHFRLVYSAEEIT